MTDVPVQVVVAAFQDEQAASAALEELKELKKERLVGIIDAAVIRKDEEGKIHLRETADLTTKQGAGRGALLGGALSLLAGPLGLMVVAGAAVGGLAARHDAGFRDDRLEQLGEALKPGTSAIVAVVEHTWVAELEKELADREAEVTTAALADDIAEQLESGGEVSYTAVASDEGAFVGRMAANESGGDAEFIATSDEGTVAGAVSVERTPDEGADEEKGDDAADDSSKE
jgi:uncharacterized membrane protein